MSFSAVPKPGTRLERGAKVSLSVVAKYTLRSSAEGEVDLVVFVPNTGRNLVEPQPAAIVTRGGGEVTLSCEFLVPADTDRVGVSVILAETQAMRTAKSKPVAQRIVFYPVR